MRHARYIFLLLITVSFSCGFAQVKTDSLRNVLLQQRGFAKLSTYHRLSKSYISKNADSVLFFANEALTLAQVLQNDSALAQSLGALGLALVEKADYENAKTHLVKAIEINTALNHTEALSADYNTLGNLYFGTGNNEKALEMYLRSLSLEEASGNKAGLAKTYANVAIMLGRMKRMNDATISYKKSLSLLRELGDRGGELRILVNLSSLYNNSSSTNFDTAIYYGLQARNVAETLNFPFGIAKANGVLCSAFIKNGYAKNGEQAQQFFNEGLQAAQQAKDFFATTQFTLDYNLAYLNEGYAHEALGNTTRAREIGFELLRMKFNRKDELFNLLYKAYKKENNTSMALTYLEKQKVVVDSLTEASRFKELAELQTQYETEKKEQEIQNLTQLAEIQNLKLHQQNLWLIGGAFVFFLLLIGVYLFYQQRQLRQQQATLQAEQKLLRSQMNPHFIFNSLGAIQSFILQNKASEASEYMAKFGKLMRLILENSREDFISLQQEITTLENYLQLQQARFNNMFTYTLHIAPTLDIEETGIPPMFAQPFIENALEHGRLYDLPNGHLDIRFEAADELIRVIIEDNGIGLTKATEVKARERVNHKSFATTITKERVALLNKGMKNKIELAIKAILNDDGHEQGTRVEILLPIRLG